MGFFSSFNPLKAISRIVKPVIRNPVKAITRTATTVINDPVRASLGVLTGGGSELLRVAPIVGKTYQKGVTLASEGYKIGANLYTGGLYGIASNLGTSVLSPKQKMEVDPMALNLNGVLQSVSGAFGGSQNPYFEKIGQVANFASQFVPQRTSLAVVPPSVRAAVGVGAVARVATVGRGFFNKYPSLAVSLQQLRARGQNIKRSQLYSMLRRFGPEVLVTGGLLTAAAVNELMLAGPGRKRMNPANVTALRRSMRRLESFHKLCVTSDKLRKPRARSRGKSC